MHDRIDSPSDARGLRIAVAVSRYHGAITSLLEAGAVARFGAEGGRDEDLLVVSAPGSFDLTAICRALACERRPDAVVALGCIVAGETTHDRHIADAVCQGLTAITVETGVPVALGVLTCATLEQARARAGGSASNKGDEAMAAAIRTANAVREIALDVHARERR